MKRPRLRAYLGLGLLAAGLVRLALSGDLVAARRALRRHSTACRWPGSRLLATAATSLPLRGALVAAVLLRVVFLPVTPSLTDDFYRYLWDGTRAARRHQPVPLRAGRPAARRRCATPTGRSSTTRGCGPSTRRSRRRPSSACAAAATAASLGPASSAVRRLRPAHGGRRSGGSPTRSAGDRRTVLYLLCPAVIVQTWEAAHLEIVAVCLVVLAAALLVRGRDWQAGVAARPGRRLQADAGGAAGAGAARRAGEARPLSRRLRRRRSLVPYVPYLLSGGAFGSLFESGTTWTGGSLVFSRSRRALASPDVARWLCAGGLRRRRRVDRAALPRPRATAAAFAWTLDAARRLPAGGARLVLAHAAGARPRRRRVAARGRSAWLAPLPEALAAGRAGWPRRRALGQAGAGARAGVALSRPPGGRHTEAMTRDTT